MVLLPDDDHNSISAPMILINVESFLREYFSSITAPMPQVEIPWVLLNPTQISQQQSSEILTSLFHRLKRLANAIKSSLYFVLFESIEVE
jgi:hypothetical protein